MKNFVAIIFFIACRLLQFSAADGISQNFHQCQKKYDESIGEIIASSGMRAASTVWKILFDNLDLNSNNRLSASEIVMKLGAEDLTLHAKMSTLLPQAQQWIDLAKPEGGDHELKLNGFVDAVGKSIGRVETVQPENENASDLLVQLCVYFNQKIPEIVGTIRDLSNCTSFLKKDQIQTMGSTPKRMIGNTWKAAFSTLDKNNDGFVSTEELTNAFLTSKLNFNMSNETANTRLNSYLNQRMLNQIQFLKSITSLLFRNSTWENITSTPQLMGNEMFCEVLRNVRNDVISWLEKNRNCVTSYKQALERHLGGQSSIAPGYLNALADIDKNGQISKPELEELVHSVTNKNFRVFDVLGNKSFSMQNIPLPNVVLETTNQSNNTGNVFELSRLSTKQHETWNLLCLTTTKLIQLFPPSVEAIQGNLTNSQLVDSLKNRLLLLPESENAKLLAKLNSLISDFSQTSNSPVNATLQTLKTETTATETSEIHVTRQSTATMQTSQSSSGVTNSFDETNPTESTVQNGEFVKELEEQVKESHTVMTEEERELHELVMKSKFESKLTKLDVSNQPDPSSETNNASSEEEELEKLLQDAMID